MAGVERKIKIKRYTGTGTDWDTILPVTKADIVTIDPSITIHGVSQSNVQSAIVQLNTYKVDTGATILKVNNNNVTPSDSPTKEIYAPTTGGTSGNYLESSGSTSAPTWKSKVTDIANITSANENNLPTSKTVKDYIDEKVTGVYIPKGAVAFDEISPMPPTASGLGWVYEITNDFTIASSNTNWVASARGKSFQAGTNVVCIDIGSSSSHDYKWDVLSGILNYKTLTVNNTADGQKTYNGSQDVTVNIPTSLKNPYSITLTGKEPSGGTSQELSYDGSVAKTVQVGENDGSDYAIYPTVNGNTIKLNLGYHASSSTKYGIGTSSLYGHNKLKTGEILNRNIHITGTDSATATETDGVSASGAHTHFDLNDHEQTNNLAYTFIATRSLNYNLFSTNIREYVSTCKVHSIIGGSLGWNQIIDKDGLPLTTTINGVTFTNNNDGSITVSGLATADAYVSYINSNVSIPATHRILLKGCPTGGSSNTYYMYPRNDSIGASGYAETGKGIIFSSSTYAMNGFVIYVTNGTNMGTGKKFIPQMTDLNACLTKPIADYIVGLETAEAGTGIAWFKRYFPKPYYPYKAIGSFTHVKISGKRYTKFNQFDLATFLSQFSDISAVPNASLNGKFIWENKCGYNGRIEVYKSGITIASGSFCYINFIYTDGTQSGFDTNAKLQIDNSIVSASGKEVKKISIVFADNGTQNFTNAKMCISFYWDGSRSGEYEDYNPSTYDIDPIDIIGIPKLDANGNLYFEGNKYNSDGVVDNEKNVVDLSTLTWDYNSDRKLFYTTRPDDMKAVSSNAEVFVGFCPKYQVASMNDARYDVAPTNDKMICMGFITTNSQLAIRDDSLNGNTSSITGYLIYQKATATQSSATPFSELQSCDNWGAEIYLPPANDTRDVEVPVSSDTDYAISLKDAVDNALIGMYNNQESINSLNKKDVTILNNGSAVAKQTTEENGNLIINTLNGVKSTYDSTNHRVKVESDLKSLSLSGYSSAQGQEVGIEYKGITNNSTVTFGDGLDTSKSGQNLTVVLKSHAWSSGNGYGKGTTSNYGHVKLVTGDMNGATNTDGEAVSKNHTLSQYSLTTHNHSGVYLENVNYSSDSSSVTDSPVISVVKSGNNVQAKKSNSISLNDITVLANQGAKISFNRSSGGNAWNIGINSSDLNTGELSLYQGTDSPTPFIRVSDGSSGKIELKKNTEVTGLISEIVKSGSATLTQLQDKYVYKIPIGTSAPTDRDYKTGDLWFEALKYVSATVSNLGSSNPSSVTFNNTGFTKDNLGITEVTLSDNNVYIKIPTMYRKVNTVADNQITSFTISNVQLDGSYEPYPCFLDESGYILPYICIGKQWYGASQTPANGRTACRNLGTGFQMYDWMIQKLWQDLMIMLNSSVNIGNTSTGAVGINSSTYLDTLGIFWGANSSGNTGFWVDGIIKDTTGYFYACDKPSYYASLSGTGVSASTLSNYNKVNYTLPHHTATTWYEISKLGYDENYPFVNFPSGDTSNSSYNTYYCDGLYSASGSRPVFSNAGYASAYNGAFLCLCHLGWSDSYAVRSCYRPL